MNHSELLTQLGGNRFMAMTGVQKLLGTPNSLVLMMRSNPKRASRVVIRLDPSDTYTLTTHDRAGNTKEEYTDIYADQIQNIFTEATGLVTTF